MATDRRGPLTARPAEVLSWVALALVAGAYGPVNLYGALLLLVLALALAVAAVVVEAITLLRRRDHRGLGLESLGIAIVLAAALALALFTEADCPRWAWIAVFVATGSALAQNRLRRWRRARRTTMDR